MPLLTQIAHLNWFPEDDELLAYLLPDIVVCYLPDRDLIVFRVVDYRTNYSTCFMPDVDIIKELTESRGRFRVLLFFPRR